MYNELTQLSDKELANMLFKETRRSNINELNRKT